MSLALAFPGTSPTYWADQMADDPQMVDTAIELLTKEED